MSEKHYKIIGKTPQMRSVLVANEKGELVQRGITRGITFEIPESAMNFHIRRQEARKILKVVEVVAEARAEVKEAPAVSMPVPVTRRRKTRKKKG